MIPKADPSGPGPPRIGVDAGATLAKLAIQSPSGALRFAIVPSYAIERAAREVESLGPERLGLTGVGAPALRRLMGLDTTAVGEFDAWGVGIGALLARQGAAPIERDLLVSVGTGTSFLLVEPGSARRVGGTSLGGGTLVGLGAAALGIADFEKLTALADRGDRRRVDLLMRDIDPGGEFPLPAELTASSLGKLARTDGADPPEPADLAHAFVGLVGEPIGMLAGTLASEHDAVRILFAGSTLRGNPRLRELLALFGPVYGRQALFVEDGEFAGALGALELAGADG